MARRDDAGKLRSLAGELGYELVKAPIRGCWFLVDGSGANAVSDRGTTAFGVDAAIKFLSKRKRRTDADDKTGSPGRTDRNRRGAE
jgi:hypothetical protein